MKSRNAVGSHLPVSSRLIIGVLTLASCAWAGTITYNVNLSVGTNAAVTGTIVTDGTIGTLALANVVSWDLTITDGTNHMTAILTPADSSIQNSNGNPSDLAATSTHLTYNFSDPSEEELAFGVAPNALCFGPSGGLCAYGSLGNVIGIADHGQEQATTYTGTQIIASAPATAAVPEPSSMLLLGSVLLGGIVKRRLFS
jgi:hypothetical protein